MNHLILTLALAVSLQAPSGERQTDTLEVAQAAAKANAAGPLGKAYQEELGRAFGKEHSGTVGACAKSLKRPALTNFSMLIEAEPDGHIRDILLKPETNLATCVRDRLKAWKAPAPPKGPSYWAQIDVVLQPK